MKKYLIHLPLELTERIQSYLYFSYETYKRLKPIHFIIKNHNNNIWNYLYIHFNYRYDILNKRIFKYLIIHNDIYIKLNKIIMIHFDQLTNIKQTKQIINYLSYFELNQLYHYIMYDTF